MNNLIRYPLFAAITSVVLSAYGCGGSGGGSPSANMDGSPSADMDGSPAMGTMEPDQPDEPFIDPRITEDAEWHAELSEYADAVRMATGGSSPTLSSADHDAKLREITANADTITGLAFWSEADGNFAQYDPDCSGTVCTNGSADSGDYTTTETLIGPKEDVVFFPVMRRHGTEFNFAQGEGDHSAGRALGEFDSETINLVLDHLAGSSGALAYEGGQEWFGMTLWGDSTASNPAVGSASWSGALVGVAYDDEDDAEIFGDVEVTVTFGNETVLDVMFSNVSDPEGSRYTIDPWIGVPVSGGSFEVGEPLFYNDEEDSRHVQGRFFGPDAEEVGGLFADDGVSMPGTTTLGVFGAVRGDE